MSKDFSRDATTSSVTLGLAYHEAGHAIVVLALGQPLWRVLINPQTQSGECYRAEPTLKLRPGFTDLDFFDAVCDSWKTSGTADESKHSICARAIELCAGRAAARLIDSEATAWHDDHKIKGLAALFPHEPDFEDQMRARAQELILQHRGEIDQVANALVERHQLSGDEVRALIRTVDVRYREMQVRIA